VFRTRMTPITRVSGESCTAKSPAIATFKAAVHPGWKSSASRNRLHPISVATRGVCRVQSAQCPPQSALAAVVIASWSHLAPLRA